MEGALNTGRLATLKLTLGVALLSSMTAFGSARADDAVDLAVAAQQFLNSCGVCHSAEPKAEIRQGPNLATAFGRTAGTLAEFPTYSDALKKVGAAGLVWNEETLDKWITNAAEFVPGSSMPYSQPDAAKRKLIVAYLKGLAGGAAAPEKK
jgi:cytochrome c